MQVWLTLGIKKRNVFVMVPIKSPDFRGQKNRGSSEAGETFSKKVGLKMNKRELQKVALVLVDHWASFFLQHQRQLCCFDVAACCLRYSMNGEMSSCKVPL